MDDDRVVDGAVAVAYLPEVSAAGNDWQKSAGDFMCLICRRKRLPAGAFSKSQVKKALKSHKGGGELGASCLKCQETDDAVASTGEKLKSVSIGSGGDGKSKPAAKTAAMSADADGPEPTTHCWACRKDKPKSQFSRKMLTKPPAKHRCLKCVEKSQASEEAKLAARREAQAAGVPKSGKAAKFQEFMAETAREAEVVTGISVKRGGGRGRGRGRGRGGRGGFGNSALRRGPTNALRTGRK